MDDPVHQTTEDAHYTNRAVACIVIAFLLACILAAVLILAAKGML